MATQTTVELIDDVDGTPADRTFTFAIEGMVYELDLSEGNVKEFYGLVDEFVQAARPAGKTPGARRGEEWAEKQARQERLAKVRAWAATNGITIAPRGRVAARVIDAYRAGRPELATAR